MLTFVRNNLKTNYSTGFRNGKHGEPEISKGKKFKENSEGEGEEHTLNASIIISS